MPGVTLHFVLADQAIHPWIGRGVGELLTGSGDRFVDGASNPHARLRVEIGLDAFYARRHPEVTRRRLEPAFRNDETDFLVRAYAATYGFVLPTSLFQRSHRATTRRVRQALASMGIVAALTAGDGFLGLPALRLTGRSSPLPATLAAVEEPQRRAYR